MKWSDEQQSIHSTWAFKTRKLSAKKPGVRVERRGRRWEGVGWGVAKARAVGK